MYTDDIVFAAVGTDQIFALLRAWHRVTRTIRLSMAIPEKRQAGASVLWLGVVSVAAVGVLFHLPPDKLYEPWTASNARLRTPTTQRPCANFVACLSMCAESG
eukprot:5833676-Pleurochrysis_carterae.AAC.2